MHNTQQNNDSGDRLFILAETTNITKLSLSTKMIRDHKQINNWGVKVGIYKQSDGLLLKNILIKQQRNVLGENKKINDMNGLMKPVKKSQRKNCKQIICRCKRIVGKTVGKC